MNFGEVLDRFEAEFLPERRLKPKSLKDTQQMLRRIRRELGERGIEGLRVADIAAFLDELAPRSSNRHRALLNQVFRFAISKGVTEKNLVEHTMARPTPKRRKRLTEEQFWKIHHHARPEIQRAMELGLVSLQRRHDLVAAKWSSIRDGVWYVDQEKTGTSLGIRCDARLNELLRRSNIISGSKFILHYGQDSRRKLIGQPLKPEALTRGFRAALVSSGLSDAKDAKNDPSFHEIRSLGAELYRKAGWPEDRIQALLGHRDAAMTRKYLEGHEREVPIVELN
ncbi:MAG: tyrosine-type recombinase/integrase [Acidiferrobacterales bacterium]|nr:tyrosine-type recombinase/integrase [Acidiferrobacterales bacterium]